MAQEDLTKIPTEELKKRAKLIKLAIIVIGISMVLMVISGIIISIRKGFSTISVTAIAFLPLIIIFSTQLTKLKEEIKNRVDKLP